MSSSDLNIKYKNVFLNGFDNNKHESQKIDTINSFLEKESNNNKTESWNKLDKTGKIRLLNNFVDELVSVHSLSEKEAVELKYYLAESIDKKKLQHVKDVHFDKVTGKIMSIPTLTFNPTLRKFTLKRSEKRISTLKSLGKGKKTANVIPLVIDDRA
jgi:hypothetical protein